MQIKNEEHTMDESHPAYEPPTVTDYGTLEQLTAVDGPPIVSDVPGGTPTGPNQDGPRFSM